MSYHPRSPRPKKKPRSTVSGFSLSTNEANSKESLSPHCAAYISGMEHFCCRLKRLSASPPNHTLASPRQTHFDMTRRRTAKRLSRLTKLYAILQLHAYTRTKCTFSPLLQYTHFFSFVFFLVVASLHSTRTCHSCLFVVCFIFLFFFLLHFSSLEILVFDGAGRPRKHSEAHASVWPPGDERSNATLLLKYVLF